MNDHAVLDQMSDELDALFGRLDPQKRKQEETRRTELTEFARGISARQSELIDAQRQPGAAATGEIWASPRTVDDANRLFGGFTEDARANEKATDAAAAGLEKVNQEMVAELDRYYGSAPE